MSRPLYHALPPRSLWTNWGFFAILGQYSHNCILALPGQGHLAPGFRPLGAANFVLFLKFTLTTRAAAAAAERIICTPMSADLNKYRHHLDGTDLSEAQKAQLIHELFAIMEAFADRAFGLHPAQQCRVILPAMDSSEAKDQLDSLSGSRTSQFKQSAGPSGAKGAGHEGK